MLNNGDYTVVSGLNTYSINILPNYSTLKVDISLTNSFTIDFTQSQFSLLLGWNQAVCNFSGIQSGQSQANINNNVNSLLIHCDIVSQSYINSDTSDVLYSFVAASYLGKLAHDAMVEPPLTIDTPPQGTLKGDMLPVKNTIEVIDPKNHTINLGDGRVKLSNTVMYNNPPLNSVYRYGSGLKGKRRKSGGNLNKILNNKSKDILNGLISAPKKGKGIYQI
jgi:hypothetical protein